MITNLLHGLSDWLFTIGSITAVVYGCFGRYYLIPAGVIGFIVYPAFLETWLNVWASITYSRKKNRKEYIEKKKVMKNYFGIIYSHKYNITAFGLEKLHPFDSIKYKRAMLFMREKYKLVGEGCQIWSPDYPSRGQLRQTITKMHLFLMNYSLYVSKIVELPIFFLPSCIVRTFVLNPMLLQVQGSIDAVAMAFAKGFAINLAGGYHHACSCSGGGFCIYADITLAIQEARRCEDIKRVMIIDLDAHMGNGHERDFINDDDCFIIDFFNPNIYPGDVEAERAIKRCVYVDKHDTDESYHRKMESNIPECISTFNPEFVVYNAGTDCMIGDMLGRMNVMIYFNY